MKCPRDKFKFLDYSSDVDLEQQKQEICKGCIEYKGEESEWGQHCNAGLTCLITGERLGPEALYKLPKHAREHATHSLSDEGQKEWNKRLADLKKHTNRPLW